MDIMDEVLAPLPPSGTDDPLKIKYRRSLPRWIIPALATQLVVALTVGLSVNALVQRFDRLALLAHNTNREVESGVAKTTGLQGETEGLKSEIQSLRQYIASSSSEDVVFLKITILKPDIDLDLARVIARNVHRYSLIYRRDTNLVLAIIAVESKFNPKASSSVGAQGLMQVMPQWKKVLAITGDLNDPEVNIRYGLQILGFYSEMYQNLEVALTAYNRGPGPVDLALMHGRNPKNGYAPHVLQTYERLKKLTVASPEI